MCERWPRLDHHPPREFTDHLAIYPSAHTRSLGGVLALRWGELSLPSLAHWTAAVPSEEGAWLLGDQQKWAASSQAG